MNRFILWIYRLANYDFCPSANQYVNWLKEPVGWVVTAIAFSILIGIFVGPQGYVLACAFLALLVLGLIWPWLSMKGIRSEIVFPLGRLSENEKFDAVFKVRNYWPLPVFGLMVKGDFLQELGPEEEPVAFSLKHVPAWSQAEFQIPITPRRRGQLPCGETQLINGFPFGLIDISKSITVSTPVLIWPARQPLDGQPAACGTNYNMFGALCDRSGTDGETIGVRCYQNGDRLRSIHWAQTVRSQTLMVRERQTMTSTAATVVLDLATESHVGQGVQNSYEWAIRIAASVCWQLHQAQSSVQLFLIGADSLDETKFNNQRGIQSLMDSFAKLPTLDDASAKQTNPIAPQVVAPTGSQHCFFVGTSRSSEFYQLEHGVRSILLDLNGFAPLPQVPTLSTADKKTTPAKVPASDPPTPSVHKQPDLLVTSPEQAADELALDWTRNFCHPIQ